MNHSVTFQRTVSKRVDDGLIRGHVEFLVDRALKIYRRKGWQCRITTPKAEQQQGNWFFSCVGSFSKNSVRKSKKSEENQWLDILDRLATAAEGTKFGKWPWKVLSNGKQHSVKKEETGTGSESTEIVVHPRIPTTKNYYDKLCTEPGTHFDHLYDRDDQIGVVQSAVSEAIRSEFNNRYNVVLHGPPGCGKTDIMRSCQRMLGEENEAYMNLDATSATAAGVAKILLESDYIPPVLFVEEIEKADEKDLKWLLGVTDIRAEIRRTNFRVGNASKSVKMLCIATVNNMDLFSRIAAGALRSRFPLDVYCPRPTLAVMRKILEREILKNKGKMDWIEPTLKYAEAEDITDPRKIVPIMLCGKDKLLDGSYQQMLERIKTPKG